MYFNQCEVLVSHGDKPCRLVDVHWRFRGTYCLHHQGIMFVWNIGHYPTTRVDIPENTMHVVNTAIWLCVSIFISSVTTQSILSVLALSGISI
jgi:hypothetical protein